MARWIVLLAIVLGARVVRADDRVWLGGLLQADGRWFFDDGAAPQVDQFAIRSLRPEVFATVDDDHIVAQLVPDFAGGKLVVQGAYVDLRYLPFVTLRAGKMKVPFGLERLQYEGTPMFAERGLPTQIAPNRDVGAVLYGTIARVVDWELGVFNGVPDGAIGDNEISPSKDYAARVFVTPFPCPGTLFHGLGLGVAATYGHDYGTIAAPELAAYNTEGLNTIASYAATTSLATTAVADGLRVREDAQAYWFAGPVGLLAEYARSTQRVRLGPDDGDVIAQAWVAEAQWVVTGEDAGYDGVKPHAAFDYHRGHWGAVDVVARYDVLWFDDAAYAAKLLDPTKSAQRASGYALGVDWFLSSHVRLTVDGERTTFHLGFAKSGDRPPENVVTARVQASF